MVMIVEIANCFFFGLRAHDARGTQGLGAPILPSYRRLNAVRSLEAEL